VSITTKITGERLAEPVHFDGWMVINPNYFDIHSITDVRRYTSYPYPPVWVSSVE